MSGNLSRLFAFLKMSFHGGTDAAPALRHAIDMMQSQAYQKADVLMISDFVMAHLPKELLSSIHQQRFKQNSFYSLVIGSKFIGKEMRSFFDQEWVYDPKQQSIKSIMNPFYQLRSRFDRS